MHDNLLGTTTTTTTATVVNTPTFEIDPLLMFLNCDTFLLQNPQHQPQQQDNNNNNNDINTNNQEELLIQQGNITGNFENIQLLYQQGNVTGIHVPEMNCQDHCLLPLCQDTEQQQQQQQNHIEPLINYEEEEEEEEEEDEDEDDERNNNYNYNYIIQCQEINPLQALRVAYESTCDWTTNSPCNSQNPLKCPQCRYSTCHRTDMLDHINSKHIRYPAFQCSYCQENYFSKRKMKEHIRRKHENKKSPNTSSSSSSSSAVTGSSSPEKRKGSLKRVAEVESVKVTIQADIKKPKYRVSCPVCLCVPDKYVSTLCGHIFCESCIRKVADSFKSCPMCQKPIDKKSVHPIYL